MNSIWKTLKELFEVLPKGAKPFYIWYSIVTGSLAVLDTVALGLIVVVATPIAGGEPIVLPVIGEIPESSTALIMLIVVVLFILKGVLAIGLHWIATRRFAKYELQIGDQLFEAYTRSSWEKRSLLSTAEVTRIVDSSMANTNLGFILPLSQIPTNALTFISVFLVLIIAQPVTALVAVIYLSIFFSFTLIVVGRKSRQAGTQNRKYAYYVATIMTEMVEALKEVTLRGKLDEIGGVISKNRKVATRARANMSFLNIVPKYVYEMALIGGFLVIGGTGYFMGGLSQAMISIALFAVTGFRMIPAMNGVQGSFTAATANEVYARDVIREIKAAKKDVVFTQKREDTEIIPVNPSALKLENISFSYPGTGKDVLKNISLEVPIGSTLAIVGPSGSGKSTLIDLMLGLSYPGSGKISLDDIELKEVMNQWRDRVGYVPQKVALFDSSIAQNVALTWEEDYRADKVKDCLRKAQLEELIVREGGIKQKIGEKGTSISGGQQQRLGIARALYTDPIIMVLDEATSSLDTATEKRVTEAMSKLQGEVTFITVAHRLATIRDYDQVCYLDDGQIVARGSFDEVVARVPEFKMQASLAGLI